MTVDKKTTARKISVEGVKDAGAIKKLPGMGRRQVSLGDKTHGFVRDGLAQLSNKSWIRSEPAHASAHNGTYMGAYDHPDNICIGCKRTLGAMFGYTEQDWRIKRTVPTYEIVRFVPRGELDNDKHGDYICFDCATDREHILHALEDVKHIGRYRDAIAADGQDVFEFVAQSIREHKLHGSDKFAGVELRLLHGGLYGGGMESFHHIIGGRIAYHLHRTQPKEQNRLKAIAAREQKLQEATADTADKVAEQTTPADKPKVVRKRITKHERN